MTHKAPESLFKKFKTTSTEKEKYVFDELRDFQILEISKKLGKLKLSTSDKEMIKLIKTQLYADWRRPLLIALRKLQKKYENL